MIMAEIAANFDISQKIKGQRIVTAYQGEFTQDLLNDLLRTIHDRLADIGVHKRTVKKVYSIIVESLENIVRHGAAISPHEVERSKIDGCYAFGKTDDQLVITVQNVIENKDREFIESKLKRINSLSKDELKAEYREGLMKGQIAEKGGAGLGFYVVRMKSCSPLDYEFKEFDDTHSYYTVQIKIDVDLV